jgi:hypothetical protein
MNEKRIRLPSPAMVVAILALVAGFTGGAWAAKSGKLGKNVVGTGQLKANAVTNPKIAGNAVDSAKLKDGQVGLADLSGCTAGTIPIDGTCVDAASRAVDTWPNAGHICGAAGGRLPTPGDLVALGPKAGISLGSVGSSTDHWSSTLYEDDAVFEATTVDDSAARAGLAPTATRPFICVYQRVR